MHAAALDALMKFGIEECTRSMEQRSNNAAAKAAPIKANVEESVGDTGLRALHTSILYSKPIYLRAPH